MLDVSVNGKRESNSARSTLFRLSRITELLDKLPTLQADPTFLLVEITLKEKRTKKYRARQWQIKTRELVSSFCTVQTDFDHSAQGFIASHRIASCYLVLYERLAYGTTAYTSVQLWCKFASYMQFIRRHHPHNTLYT